MPLLGRQSLEPANPASHQGHGAPLAEGASGFSLDQMIAVLRRRLLLIGIVVAAGTALFVGAASLLPPRYSSTAVVVLDQAEPQLSSIIEGAETRQGVDGIVATTMELVNSHEFLSRVMDQLHLYQDPAFNPPPDNRLARFQQTLASFLPRDWLVKVGIAADAGSPPTDATDLESATATKDAALHRFRRFLEVSQPPEAGAIAINYASREPAKAAAIANALADSYVRWELERQQHTAREAAAWLREQLEQLQASVSQAEQAAAQFRVEHGLTAANGGSGTLNDQRVMDLKAQLVALRAEQIQKQSTLAQALSARRPAGGGPALAGLAVSPALMQLRTQQVDLERRRAELSQVYGARHPQMLDVEAQLRAISEKIRLEVDQSIAGMRDELASLKSRENAIQDELEGLQGGSWQDRQAEVQLRELERQAIVSRDRYETLLARYREARERAEFPTSNARVISRAAPPAFPSTPGKAVFAGVGFTTSLMLGSMLAFIAEQLDRKVRSARSLERLLDIPALGVLPYIRQRRWRKHPASYIAQSPFTYYAEAAQGILAQLDQAGGASRPATVMVTSALPDEGKTTLTVSLAAAAVRAGWRACVVDLDLRRPSVLSRLEPAEAVTCGVVDYVDGAAGLDDVVGWDPKSEIAFVATGRWPKNPLRLIRSQGLDNLIAALRARFDLVIIDTPPLLALSETAMAARLADQFVLATRWSRTETAAAAEAATRLLAAVQPRFVGFALTMVDPKKYRLYGRDEAGAYYKNYREYYVDD